MAMLRCSKTLENRMPQMMNGKLFDTTEVGKMFAGFTFPGFDVGALMTIQSKNLEALTQANQLAVAGFQAFAKMQVELTRDAIEEASALVRDWAETKAPEEKLQKQAAFAKKALARGVTNTHEMVELAGKTQAAAFGVLNKRFSESMDEMASFAKKEPVTSEQNGTKKAQRR
jgi:phasin family protein